MRYVCIALAALSLTVLSLSAGCNKKQDAAAPTAKPDQTDVAAQPDAAAQPAAVAQPEQKMCPVMNEPINKQLFVDYNGRRIYFCCTMCPAQFKKDPEKYIKIVDAELAAQKASAKP